MSKTKEQLQQENDALRALVAAIGELAVTPDPADQRLAARLIKSICEEVDKYPQLLGQLAADLRERATTVISYTDPADAEDTAILAQAIEDGTTVIVEDEDDIPAEIELPGGWVIAFTDAQVPGKWFAHLRNPDGSVTESGYGDTKAAAHAHLNRRLGQPQGCPS